MVYESSYERGQKPFTPDLQRGKWEKPTDFIYACCGLALKLDLFLIFSEINFSTSLFGMLPYYFYMAIYMVPLLVIHSFMGQFSSSGFISAFRLSPFFKGMGYVSVFLSLASLLFYAIFAIVPLVFILNSLRPTLPWSCEGLGDVEYLTTLCNINVSETSGISKLSNETNTYVVEFTAIHIPSELFFKQHFPKVDGRLHHVHVESEFSWSIVGYSISIWAIIACIFRYFSEAAKFGKLLRYMILTTLGLLLLCLVRFLFLPGALDGLVHYVKPHVDSMASGGIAMTVVVLQAFGSGWGSVMSLSSFNSFKTNIMSYSWIIAFGQTLIYFFFGLVSVLVRHHYYNKQKPGTLMYLSAETNWVLYESSASALATLEWANLWTILYYSMLLTASLIVMITQIFTVLTSLFDEFELLREHKQRVTFGLIGFLALCSLLFCTNHDVVDFSAVTLDSIFTFSVMHLLLLLAVLWIYGRERFQRDIKFMLGQPFASWKVFILRFIAPVFLFSSLLMGFVILFREYIYQSSLLFQISMFLVVLPLLFIPGYGMYITYLNTGGFCSRLRRACRPTDWYPQEMEDRQKYEEFVGNSDLTHQLYEMTEVVN